MKKQFKTYLLVKITYQLQNQIEFIAPKILMSLNMEVERVSFKKSKMTKNKIIKIWMILNNIWILLPNLNATKLKKKILIIYQEILFI
jgi:hypothetical protein